MDRSEAFAKKRPVFALHARGLTIGLLFWADVFNTKGAGRGSVLFASGAYPEIFL